MGATQTLFGLFLVVLGCSLNALGFCLQEYSQKRKTGDSVKFLLYNFGGIFLTIFSAVFDFLSLGYAPQSVLAPAGVCTLLFNFLFSKLLLKKSTTSLDTAATILICLGVANSAILGPNTAATFSPEATWFFATRWQFLIFFAAYLASIFFIYKHVRKMERIGRGRNYLIALLFPALGGLLSGLLRFSAKLLSDLWPHKDSIGYLVFFPILILLALSAVTHVSVMNEGVRKHGSLIVIPMFTAVFLSANLLFANFFFNEFSGFGFFRWIFFGFGILLVWFGIGLIAIKDTEKGIKLGSNITAITQEWPLISSPEEKRL